MTYIVERPVPQFSIPDANLASLKAQDGHSAVKLEDGTRMVHIAGAWQSVNAGGGGAPVFAPPFMQTWAASVIAGGQGLYTKSLQGAATFQATCTATVLTITAITTGQVWPGQTCVGTSITAASTIGTQISGTPNGIGTYNLIGNTGVVAAAEAMTSAAVPPTGQTLRNWYDSGAFSFYGGPKAGTSGTSAGYCYNPSPASASDTLVPQLVEFDLTLTAGQAFTIVQQIVTANAYAGIKVLMAPWVGGVPPTKAIMQTQFSEKTAMGSSVAQDLYMLTLTVATAGQYRIILWIDQGFKGIYSATAATVTNRARNGMVVVMDSDSWENGGNAGIGGTTIAGAIVDNHCLEAAIGIGADEVIVFSQPGTGWVNDGTNVTTPGVMTAARTPLNSTRRMQALVSCNGTHYIVGGSVNDITVSTGGGYNTLIASRVTQWLNYVMPQLGKYTKVYLKGGQYQNLYPKASFTPIDTQITAGILASNWSTDTRIKQMILTQNNLTTGTPFLTGTGNTAAPAGDGGNSDLWLNSDSKHLNQLGQYNWGSGLIVPRVLSLGV